jgi:hypothetical protein
MFATGIRYAFRMYIQVDLYYRQSMTKTDLLQKMDDTLKTSESLQATENYTFCKWNYGKCNCERSSTSTKLELISD